MGRRLADGPVFGPAACICRAGPAGDEHALVSHDQERAGHIALQSARLKAEFRHLKRELVPAEDVHRLGTELGGAIRKVLTRVHRVAPSLEGRKVDVIEARLREQEEDVLALLQILEDRLAAWQRAE